MSVILEKRPELIEQLALCLDSEMRSIPDWIQLAKILRVDENVIQRLLPSPTIRLFEFLEVTHPVFIIKQLKDALLEIRRSDLFSLLFRRGMLSRASSTRARVEGSIPILNFLSH